MATDADVEEKFTESKSPYTEEEFQNKLKETGLTVDDLKNEIRRELSIQKLLNREVLAKISITDKDITDFYNQNRAQFNVAEPQYRIAQIVVTPRPDPSIHNRKNDKATTETEARQKSWDFRAEAGNDGGRFYPARSIDYSEDTSSSTGGDLGFHSPSRRSTRSDPVLKKTVAFSMKVGESTPLIPVKGGGYRILKLLAKEVAGQRELSDPQVQQGIRDMLRNRKEQLLRATAYPGRAARRSPHHELHGKAKCSKSAGQLPN